MYVSFTDLPFKNDIVTIIIYFYSCAIFKLFLIALY